MIALLPEPRPPTSTVSPSFMVSLGGASPVKVDWISISVTRSTGTWVWTGFEA